MNKAYSFCSKIGQIITDYLTLKWALGRKYESEFSILKQLDKFLSNTQNDLTTESFSAWCHTMQHLTSTGQREHMRVVRNFCLYRQRTEPSCFIPNLLQFPKRLQPIQPHIFTEAEIICLLNAIPQDSSNIKSLMLQENLRLGLILLYTTGLRHGELIRLTIGDYNPTERTLLIRETKYHKSRLIPLSCDGWTALESLLKKR